MLFRRLIEWEKNAETKNHGFPNFNPMSRYVRVTF